MNSELEQANGNCSPFAVILTGEHYILINAFFVLVVHKNLRRRLLNFFRLLNQNWLAGELLSISAQFRVKNR